MILITELLLNFLKYSYSGIYNSYSYVAIGLMK